MLILRAKSYPQAIQILLSPNSSSREVVPAMPLLTTFGANLRQNHVFISYNNVDISFAIRLDAALRRQECDPWVDWDDMPQNLSQSEREQCIREGIENADVVVLVVSPDFMVDDRNRFEREQSIKSQKLLIPIQWQPLHPDQGLPPELETVQWLQVQQEDHENQYEQIALTIIHLQIYARLKDRVKAWDQHQQSMNRLLRKRELEAVQVWCREIHENVRYPIQLTELQQQYIQASSDIVVSVQPIDVFISYSRKNKEFVEKLYDDLLNQGINVWIDWDNIPKASDWWREIQEGIELANKFLFVISPDSVKSLYCQAEVAHAMRRNKLLLPVQCWDVDRALWEKVFEGNSNQPVMFKGEPIVADRNQPVLVKAVGDYMKRYNWIRFQPDNYYSLALDNLLEAIQKDEQYVKDHTRLLLRAIEWDNQGREDDLLLIRKNDLEKAQKWLKESNNKEPKPTTLQHIYIEASIRAREATEQQKRRLLNIFTTAVSIVSLGFTLGIFWALSMSVRSQIDTLVKSLEEPEGLEALVTALKAAEGLQRSNFAIRWLITQIIDEGLETRVLTVLNQEITQLRELEQLRGETDGHRELVFNVNYSPDGQYLASSSRDRTVKLWDKNGHLLHTLAGHEKEVINAIFSPDGDLLASFSYDNTIKLWQVSTGTLLQTLAEHNDTIYTIAFSPGGGMLASASQDGTVKLWQREDGFQRPITLTHGSPVYAISFSRLGNNIATAAANGTIKVWSRTDGFRTPQLELIHSKNPLFSISFSPDLTPGQGVFASASQDGSIKIWDLQGREVLSLPTAHDEAINQITFSPTGQLLASASADKTAKLWPSTLWRNPTQGTGSVPDGKPFIALRGHQDSVHRIRFSPDGLTIATASLDRTIKLWDGQGNIVDTFTAHKGGVFSIAFTPDGQRLASASTDNSVRIWRVKNPIQALPHENMVNDISFNQVPDQSSQYLVSAGVKTLKVWREEQPLTTENRRSPEDGGSANPATWFFTPIAETKEAHNGRIWGVDFNPLQSNMLASGGDDDLLKLWKIENNRIIAGRSWKAHPNGVLTLSFKPCKQRLIPHGQDAILKPEPCQSLLASGGGDGFVSLWNLEGKRLKQWRWDTAGYVTSVDFSPDGAYLAASWSDGRVIAWEPITNKVVLELREPDPTTGDSPHPRMVNRVRFSPNGKAIALARNDGTVDLYAVSSQQRLHQLDAPEDNSPVLELSFNESGKLLASGNKNGTIHLWEPSQGVLITTLQEHKGEVSRVLFSPDGSLFASSGEDSNVLVRRQPEYKNSRVYLEQLINQGCSLVQNYLTRSTPSTGKTPCVP